MAKDSSGKSGGAVVEVEFSITDSTYPFVFATERRDCVLELAEMVPRQGDRYAEFFSITGIDPAEAEALAESYEALEVNLLREYESGGLFEFISSGNCPAYTLAELGALPREAVSLNGEGRIVVEIPPRCDASSVIETFLEATPEAELVSKRHRDSLTPVFTDSTLKQLLDVHLTDRQEEVLRAAYDAGYYEWPRDCCGKDVAEELGISSATFSEHIHAAERKLLTRIISSSERQAGTGRR